MTRAAIYRRISRDREGRELGVERQGDECAALAEQLGADVAEVLTDNDLSASTRSRKPRPAYEQLLAGARGGSWDLIIAWSSSRLTRRPLELEGQIQLAEQYGTRFAYVKSPSFDLNTAQGRMIARQLAAVDAAEAEMTAERLTAQKRQAAAAGQWRGGRRPYGYAADGVSVEPTEAAHVTFATRQVLVGASLRSLAVALNHRGALTSTGRQWSATELRRVLLRARNAGLIEHDGEILGEAVWEPIVTRAEWEAVCRVLRDPSRRVNGHNTARRWMGTGLYRCGACDDGTTVRCAAAASGRQHSAPYYTCSATKHLSRHARQTDKMLKAAVLGWVARPEVASQLAASRGVDLDALDRRERQINDQLDEAAEMFAARVWTRQRVERIAAPLNAELAEIQEQRVQAAAGHPADELIGADDLEAAWEALDVSRRQAIVDAVAVVTLLPARRGRPPGWCPGQPYFDPESIRIEWL